MISLTDVQLAKIITPVVLGYRNELFIWDKVAPVIEVTGSKGYIPKFGHAHQRHLEFRVSPYSESMSVDSDVSTTAFSCEVHRGSGFVPEEIELQSDIPINLVTHKAGDVAEAMQLEQELDVASWMKDNSNFTNTGTPSTTWDASGGDPAADFKTIKAAILTKIGRLPNWAVATPDVDLFLAYYVAEQRVGGGSAAMAGFEEIAKFIGVKNYAVGMAQYNSSVKRAAASMANAWGTKNFWMYYSNPSTGATDPTFCATVRNKKLTKSDTEVKKDPPGTKLIVRHCYDFVKPDETAGYFRETVLT